VLLIRLVPDRARPAEPSQGPVEVPCLDREGKAGRTGACGAWPEYAG
jgi:hypothetical protein